MRERPTTADGTHRRGGWIPRRARQPLALLLAGLGTVGCYSYTPAVSVQPSPGQQVALDLSDAGRVHAGERLGPGVLRVEGTVGAVDSAAYELRVSHVSYLGGQRSSWSGERVQLQRTDVARVLQRKFSPGRTAVAVGTGAAALGAFIVTRKLVGDGGTGSGPRPRDPPPSS